MFIWLLSSFVECLTGISASWFASPISCYYYYYYYYSFLSIGTANICAGVGADLCNVAVILSTSFSCTLFIVD